MNLPEKPIVTPETQTAGSFSPREIVSELDRYIVGQAEAKRSVAVALRNRWRRQQLPAELREEVLPKNPGRRSACPPANARRASASTCGM